MCLHACMRACVAWVRCGRAPSRPGRGPTPRRCPPPWPARRTTQRTRAAKGQPPPGLSSLRPPPRRLPPLKKHRSCWCVVLLLLLSLLFAGSQVLGQQFGAVVRKSGDDNEGTRHFLNHSNSDSKYGSTSGPGKKFSKNKKKGLRVLLAACKRSELLPVCV